MNPNDRPAGREARRPLVITRYPGGKRYLYEWISGYLPASRRFVEGFAGAATVLLNRPRAEEEILIEKNSDQATLLRVSRDQPEELADRLRPVRWSRLSFLDARFLLEEGAYDDDLERAALVYTVRIQSFGSLGRSFSFVFERHQQRSWDRRVRSVAAASRRLQGVQILEGNALDLLSNFDGPDTLVYLDPPYVRSSRSPATLYGRYEMTDEEHRDLCLVIRQFGGRVALSGYPNPIYDGLLNDWSRVSRAVPVYAHRRRGPRDRRTEVLWLNY